MLSPTDLTVVNEFHSELDRMYLRALRGKKEVILLEQPAHRNLGDTLIWAGQLDTLCRLGIKIRYTATLKTARGSEIATFPTDWPILCQGGGNFGDIYFQHYNFREEVVKNFPDRHIIFLPNTTYFKSESEITRMREALRPAKDLTLMMRSRRSEAFAKEHFSEHETLYCIDSALGVEVHPTPRFLKYKATKPNRVHLAARNDPEAYGDASAITLRPMDTVGDWPFPIPVRARWKLSRLATDRPLANLPDGFLRTQFRGIQSRLFTSANLNAYLTAFNGAGVVATNRLHAHVYCALAGIPHVVTDNSYGKISEIYREYTHKFSTAHWAESLPKAYAKAVELSERSAQRSESH